MFLYSLVNHLTWESTWGDTHDVIRKKVLSDAQTHAYMTSIDDIQKAWSDYDWYNTELNPVKPVNFTAKRIKSTLFLSFWHHKVLFRVLSLAG